MQNDQRRLLEILRKNSVSYGDFTLSSGKKSNYYVDAKLTTFDPEGISLVGRLVFEIIKDRREGISAVGGLTMGADPIAISTIITALHNNYPLTGFSVRKEPKSHGKKRLVEGNLDIRDKVAILDDVITTGASTIKAIESVKELGCSIIMVIALVDRREGGTEKIREMGYDVRTIFNIEDMLDLTRLGGIRSNVKSEESDSFAEQRFLRKEFV